MELVVLFEKIELATLKEKKSSFGENIGSVGKILNANKGDNDIHVRILEGQRLNTPEKEKVIIWASSDEIMNNMGEEISEFKVEVLKVFEKYGIQLDKHSLNVKAVPPYDINAYINEVRNMKNSNIEQRNINNDEFDYEQKSKQYVPVEPLYSFDRVILPKEVLDKIEEAVGILECENKVFNEWGLYEIQPHPSTSLSFYGPSGTGKTMAAEAIAHKLGKKILKVSYADVESKYHGEGPKMVKSIFLAATNNDVVLFFDEADSLLSKRLTSVSQGSEQAINSMRSQLLICLEEFRGIVIFATNLVVNYDQAFLTRLISVEFKNPDAETREIIWNVHIKPLDDGKQHQLNIPLASDVDTKALAEKFDFAGREIRNAVVSACVGAAMAKQDVVAQENFIRASNKIVDEKKALSEVKVPSNSLDIIKMSILDKVEKIDGEGTRDVSTIDEQ